MKVAPEFKAVVFATTAWVALIACSSSDKAPATASKDSGAGGGSSGGATAIFTPGPDAGKVVPLGDAAVASCGGFGRAVPACEACLRKSCCDPAKTCAKTSGCPQNAAC